MGRLPRVDRWCSRLLEPAPFGPWRVAWEIGFLVLSLVPALPLFVVHHVPIQDLPQHAAAVRVLCDYDDAALSFVRFFERTPLETQYLSAYALAGLLSPMLGAVVAVKVVLMAAITGLPYALRALLAELDKPRAYAIAVLPLLHNAQLILGFLNFLLGLPLCALGLWLAARLRRRRSGAALGLCLTLLAAFTTHVLPYAVLVAGSVTLLATRDRRLLWSRLWPFLPSLMLALVWLLWSPAGRALTALSAESGSIARVPPLGERLASLPMWLSDVLPGSGDTLRLAIWALGILLVVGSGLARRGLAPPRDSAERRILWLPAAAMALYFLSPESQGWVWPIHARFALVSLTLAIAFLPRVSARLATCLVGGSAVLALVSSAALGRAFLHAERSEISDLDAVLEQIPLGRRVVGLIFDPTSRFVRFSPYLHAVAWYQAERGGAVMFTFADFPQSPFRFKETQRPPRVPPRWEWQPARVDPARDLDYYEYVLSRGAPRDLQGWEPVNQQGAWAVWVPRR